MGLSQSSWIRTERLSPLVPGRFAGLTTFQVCLWLLLGFQLADFGQSSTISPVGSLFSVCHSISTRLVVHWLPVFHYLFFPHCLSSLFTQLISVAQHPDSSTSNALNSLIPCCSLCIYSPLSLRIWSLHSWALTGKHYRRSTWTRPAALTLNSCWQTFKI